MKRPTNRFVDLAIVVTFITVFGACVWAFFAVIDLLLEMVGVQLK